MTSDADPTTRQALERCLKDLQVYGHHLENCSRGTASPDPGCTCGFENAGQQAEIALNGQPPPPAAAEHDRPACHHHPGTGVICLLIPPTYVMPRPGSDEVMRFEWHHYLGPTPLTKKDKPRHLPTRHWFWQALRTWIEQGQKVDAEGRCLLP